ncbi:MAG: hypothetical protein KJ676_07330 [Alphaproteobacteria bacterium]|nr:hypothetical protein [Alphaproteobacteria bacterium]MBU1525260.1 hypothetical protein [Alphaproteobacteria bacterium]MBU2117636.1 hypothetical protein [Alphaproteobacteria bacterium]MBU2351186.1 hypothetical protein [Alphaproteobacteria bacterium]MBU2382646.1 hypothetical protein [Alphaproteobacteria bacterium]
MSRRPPASLLAVLAVTAMTAAACATAPGGGPVPVIEDTSFDAADFAWSTQGGAGSIDGRVDYRAGGVAYTCSGSVGLVPDTPYTRSRFRSLYGSTDRAAVPEDVVRARNVPDPNADYRAFTRSDACSGNRFDFAGLPDGSWFVIAPVSGADGGRMVLMRRVTTRGGPISVSLN